METIRKVEGVEWLRRTSIRPFGGLKALAPYMNHAWSPDLVRIDTYAADVAYVPSDRAVPITPDNVSLLLHENRTVCNLLFDDATLEFSAFCAVAYVLPSEDAKTNTRNGIVLAIVPDAMPDEAVHAAVRRHAETTGSDLGDAIKRAKGEPIVDYSNITAAIAGSSYR